jgi:transketolase
MTTTTTDKQALDELCINTIRTLSIDAVEKANSGHPGAPMGLAPLGYLLFTRVMKHNPANADWADRDRFVLSAGHASMLLYSLLYLSGYPLTLDDIKNFRRVGSPTAGHPERKYTPGIEITTGPLGQGLSNSVGLALAERMLAARFNAPGHEIVDHHTYVIASDGDIQEGVASEASSLGGHLGLGRLIVFYDDNHVQLASMTNETFSEDVPKRYEAYGWHTQVVDDANDLDALEAATRTAQQEEDRPSLIAVRSHLGYGAPNKQDTPKAHGSPLGEDEVRAAKEFYGWDPDKHFYVPDEALSHFREACQKGAEAESEWNERFDAYRDEHGDKAQLFETMMAGRLPGGWDADRPTFAPADTKPMATRKASGAAIQWVAKGVPFLIGGSADLSTSNNTDIEDAGVVSKDDYSGRNIAYGVREHAMGAVINGLVNHGFRAFGGTFLTFSDYMRGAVRLAALMKLPAVYVWTHDSIGLGEDGPTHQSIEQLAALRAIPRLNVVRPADPNETVLAWRFAIAGNEAPTALALSRQSVTTLDPERVPDDAIERGAYVYRDSDGDPDVILMGTGSEVGLCLEAAEQLESDGVAVRVVSAPCLDTFAEQDDSYREDVLPRACRARVAVEAAVRMPWDRYLGEDGVFLGMSTFGESGPAKDVYEHFGITADHAAQLAREAMDRVGTRS